MAGSGREFNILLCGETGAGKSSFISTISQGEQRPVIGDGVKSETFNVNRYPVMLNGDIYYFYDVPGFMDSLLRKSNKEIRLEVIEYFLKVDQGKLNGNSFDAILVFESFKPEPISFKRNLEKLSEMFGQTEKNIGKSVIVACTKLDVRPQRNPGKFRSLKELTDDSGSFILEWQNNYIRSKGPVNVPLDALQLQINKFLELMKNVSPIEDVTVKELHAKIKALAV